MAPRPYWKGYLKLSLVTAPVSLAPAVSDREKIRFHTVNSTTGNRVRSQYVDAVTGEPVSDEDETRGYEVEKERYITIEDEEIESVGLESTHTIDISEFVPADSIGWVWYDTPYFLKPDEEIAEEAFAVIREAMAATGTVGISRLVLARRERAVLLEPSGKGIILWTLRYGDEVRDAADLVESTNDKPDPKLLELIAKLIERMTRPWDPELLHDPVQDKLKEIIAAKAKPKRRKKQESEHTAAPELESEPESNVIDIMDALRRSIKRDGGKGSGRRK